MAAVGRIDIGSKSTSQATTAVQGQDTHNLN